MFTYPLRCIQDDVQTLINLGVVLGALVHTPEHTEEHLKWIQITVVPGDEEHDPDWLLEEIEFWSIPHPLGETETITIPAHTYATGGGCWDVIGTIWVDTEEIDEEGIPVRVPLLAPDGNPWWHANLITPVDLRAVAEQMAAENPAIAASLSDLSRFFVTDAEGNVVQPKKPYRVFAS